jgi:hypothetical protein
VLHLLAEGKRTKEIAQILGVGVKTAESHRCQHCGKARHPRDGRAGPLRHPAGYHRALTIFAVSSPGILLRSMQYFLDRLRDFT